MITGVHAMFYSDDAKATRAFLRDVLELPMADSGGGWLIARAPAVEVGCHPDATEHGGHASGAHSVSFTTADLDATMATLRSRGVTFGAVNDYGYGRTTTFVMPGNVTVELYQPSYTLDFSTD